VVIGTCGCPSVGDMIDGAGGMDGGGGVSAFVVNGLMSDVNLSPRFLYAVTCQVYDVEGLSPSMVMGGFPTLG
jgi:hypothetical protein